MLAPLLYAFITQIEPVSTNLDATPIPGELYIVEDRSEYKSLEITGNYVTNLSDSFVRSHAVQLEAQIFPLSFLGFGAAFMIPRSEGTSTARGVIDLQKADIQSEILATDWAAHGFVTLLPFVGRWNFFNILQMRSKLSVQLGGGYLGTKDLVSQHERQMPTYFWRVTHALEIARPMALVFGISGDRLDNYFNLGLQLDLPLSKAQRLLAKHSYENF